MKNISTIIAIIFVIAMQQLVQTFWGVWWLDTITIILLFLANRHFVFHFLNSFINESDNIESSHSED